MDERAEVGAGPPAGGWTFAAIGRRARRVAREQGLGALAFKLLGEIAYRRVFLYERRLDLPQASEPAAPDGVSITELDGEGAAELGALAPELTAADFAARRGAGHRCFAAREAGALVHASWVGVGRVRIDYLGRELELAPGEAYLYEVRTLSRARRRGLSRAVVDRIAATLGREGATRLLAVAMPENRPGVAAMRGWGFRRLGRLARWGLGRLRLDRGAVPREPVGSADWSRALRALEERHYLDPFLGEVKRRAHLDLISRWGALPSPGRLLKTDLFEEALGPDGFLSEIAAEAGAVVGMDLSLAVVQRARARAGGARVGWLVADARRLPFAAGAFAAIVSTSTLDHFPDDSDLCRSLRELRRVTEPGGRAVVTLDNRQNLFDPLLRLVRRSGLVPYYLGRSYRASELRAELEAAGFTVAATTAILHNPRLLAVGLVRLARALRLRPAARLVERGIVAAQRLESTRWRYRTGSFVAAVAVAESPSS